MASRVYIGGLHRDTTERDLEGFCKKYGRIRDVFLKNGFGFVDFDDWRDADDAVYNLDKKELLGVRVIVQHARGPTRAPKYGPPVRTNYRVIVENLSSKVSWQDLKDIMRRAGKVTYSDAHRDRRNEGVVEFESCRDLERAIEKFDGKEIEGKKIRLIDDSRRRDRSRSASRGRSRSRTGSRSRSRSGSRSGSRSRSRSRRRSRSRSRRRDRRRERSRSRSSRKDCRRRERSEKRDKAEDSKRSKSRDRSASDDRHKRRNKSRDRSASSDRHKSRSKSRNRSASNDGPKSRSKSRNRSASNDGRKSRSKSRGRSASNDGPKNRSKSNSRDGSCGPSDVAKVNVDDCKDGDKKQSVTGSGEDNHRDTSNLLDADDDGDVRRENRSRSRSGRRSDEKRDRSRSSSPGESNRKRSRSSSSSGSSRSSSPKRQRTSSD